MMDKHILKDLYNFISTFQEAQEQAKADKIKLALEKLKEAKVKKVGLSGCTAHYLLPIIHYHFFKYHV